MKIFKRSAFVWSLFIFCNNYSTIIIRPALTSDIPLALDLDMRVAMEYFKPLFLNCYTDTSLADDPDYYLGLDVANDKKLFADCVNMSGSERLYVAYDNVFQQVSGLIVFHQENGATAEIDLLLIDKEYRRKGLGKKLVNAALEYYESISACGVYVFSRNREAITFYESLGFVNTGPGPHNRTTIYGIGFDKIYVFLIKGKI